MAINAVCNDGYGLIITAFYTLIKNIYQALKGLYLLGFWLPLGEESEASSSKMGISRICRNQDHVVCSHEGQIDS